MAEAEHNNNGALGSSIFEHVSYFVSGNVSEQVLQVLSAGGGKQLKYFSDFISHVICGAGARESDLSDADLYEVPAVTERWVTSCAQARRLLSTKGYLHNPKHVLSAAVVSTSGVSKHDQAAIWAMVTYHGGRFKRHLDASVTHLVCASLGSAKAQQCAASAGAVAVVTPDWLTESVRAKRMADPELYHPRLMVALKGALAPPLLPPAADDAADEEALKAKKEKLDALWKEMPWNKYSGGSYATRNPMQVQAKKLAAANLAAEAGLKSYMDKQFQQRQQQHLLAQQQQQQQPPQMKALEGIKALPDASPKTHHQVQVMGQGMLPSPQGRVLLQQQQMQMQQQQQHHKLQFVNMQMQQPQQQQQQMQQQLQHLHLQDGQQQQQMLMNQQQFGAQQVPQSPTSQQSFQLQQQNLMLHSPIQQQQMLQPQYQSQMQYVQSPQQMMPQQQIVAHPSSIQQQHMQSLIKQQQQAKQGILMSPPGGQQQMLQQQTPPAQPQASQNNLLLSPQHQQQQQQQPPQPPPQMPNLIMSQPNLMMPQQQGQAQASPAQPFTKVPFSPQGGQQQQQRVFQPQQQFAQPQTGGSGGGGAPGWPPQPVLRPPAGSRAPWPAGQHPPIQRQYIQLDAQTHQQLQNMAPEERAQFVEKLRKHRQIAQRQQQFIQLQQQRGGGHILIRSNAPVPQGLTPQQQMQWLQQAKQQGVVLQQQQGPPPPAVPSQQQAQPPPPPPPPPSSTGLSPIQGAGTQAQFEQAQPSIRPPLRVHQLQLQRDQAKQQQQQPVAAPATSAASAMDAAQPTRAKAALANMLSIRLSGGQAIAGEPNLGEHSAAGTLRLMTAQHNAALSTPPNRTQQILALHQQRRLSAAAAQPPAAGAGDPARPQAAATPAGQTPTAPGGDGGGKVANSPRSVMPMQHRPGVFYGHNPNLKLPANLFMLGCIFVVVEVGEQLDACMPAWTRAVELFGGEIEAQYCSRVTHVLCESQRHGVVMQALRDYKRCVTICWLRDVLERRQVLPPWMALHLPAMNLDCSPASKHLVSLTGFRNDERERVKRMVRAIGATLTTYFSQHNTLLVSAAPATSKHAHARKWGVPVVNVQWLTDVMLGHFAALHQPDHAKYQQYGSPDGGANFCFDAALVANVMQGWKMPINISQESYERVKRSASPAAQPKPKKIKVEADGAECANDAMEGVTTAPSAPHCVMLSSRCERAKELQEIVCQLGGTIARSAAAATHFVSNRLLLTMNLLVGISREVRFVSDAWLLDSAKANGFLDELAYASDAKEFNQKYSCDFNLTLATANRRHLLAGRAFFVTPSVYERAHLVRLIELCGGSVERVRRPLARVEDGQLSAPFTYVIVASVDDLHLVGDIYKRRNNKTVCGKEIIISAVLKQTFEVEPYLIKANARVEE